VHWSALDASDVKISHRRGKATITIATGVEPFWIAGQEIITPLIYGIWNNEIASEGAAELSVLGLSQSKIPVWMLNANPAAADVLLLIGRQHPPEVTGAIAFFAFYETLMADSRLAAKFRQRFNIIAVPLLNPDGVIGGNWRHNLSGTDLNRDWGPFKQPETLLIKELLDQLDASGKNIRVFLDFHSTNRNVFYIQDNVNPTKPLQFTRTWLENAKPRIRDYDFSYEENSVDTTGISKNYIYKRYGIPSTTYEVNDEIDRNAIRQAATVFAEELMLLMLEQKYE
jgi:predicted deacylase